MKNDNIIKSITIHICPRCNKEILIENQVPLPFVGSLFTPEDVDKAKKECLQRLETFIISDEKKEAIVKWLNDPETVFGPHEIDNIIQTLTEEEK